ncbi:MAG TPA: hypothetical protein VGX97_08135 [bacterium]|nr:hypothetical protein [bacterium]
MAELIGLSPASLRRWDAALLPGAERRPRRYSWAEVEILQRAVHHASGRGGTPAAFQGLRAVRPPRAGGAAAPGAGGAVGTRARGRRRGTRRTVVSVALPRSARRRDRRPQH